MQSPASRLAFPACLLLALAGAPSGQCELAELVPVDESSFGTAVALEGGLALVSRVGKLSPGSGQPVDVFEDTGAGWARTAELQGGAFGDGFGSFVALEGDLALVGASQTDLGGSPDAGAAYLFELQPSGWVEVAMLPNPQPSSFADFGVAGTIEGGRVFLGETGGNGADGFVHVYEQVGSSWTRTDTLTTGLADQGFGWSVAADGDRLVVGTTPTLSAVPRIYFYERGPTGWVQTDALPSLGADEVALRGDLAAAVGWDPAAVGPPAVEARVFEHDGTDWVETALLFLGTFFAEVAIEGERVLVGGTEGIHVLERSGSTWVATELLRGQSTGPQSTIGTALSSEGGRLLAGDSFNGPVGRAHVFSVEDLCSPTDQLSLAAGGQQTLQLSAGPDNAGELYLLLGSATGTTPGITAGGLNLPLNVDGYFLFSLLNPNVPPLLRSLAALDASGRAQADFSLPAGSAPSLAGVVLHHAFVVLDLAGPIGASFASNPQPLQLVP